MLAGRKSAICPQGEALAASCSCLSCFALLRASPVLSCLLHSSKSRSACRERQRQSREAAERQRQAEAQRKVQAEQERRDQAAAARAASAAAKAKREAARAVEERRRFVWQPLPCPVCCVGRASMCL